MPKQLALPVHGTWPQVNPDQPDRSQRWRHGHQFWARSATATPFDPGRYTVAPLERQQAARELLEAHHYLHSYPSVSRQYGLFWHGDSARALVGVATFGVPQHQAVLLNWFPDLEPGIASLDMNRFWLEGPDHARTEAPPGGERAPLNSESWFIARCLEDLAARGVFGVLMFADPVPLRLRGRLIVPGHVGAAYQAANALLTGRTKTRYTTVLPDGSTLRSGVRAGS